MFVRSTCVFRDVTVDKWNTEQSILYDNVYLLLAVPLTNYTPDISHLGITIPCGATTAIGIAFLQQGCMQRH